MATVSPPSILITLLSGLAFNFLLVYLFVIETNCVLKDNGNGHLQSNYSLHFTSIPTLNTHHFLPRTAFTLYTDREFDFFILGFRNKMVKMLPTLYGANSHVYVTVGIKFDVVYNNGPTALSVVCAQHHWNKKYF